MSDRTKAAEIFLQVQEALKNNQVGEDMRNKFEFEVVERPVVIENTVKKYVVELTAEELAVLYGLTAIVNTGSSEDGDIALRLYELFDRTMSQWYPGFYSIPEVMLKDNKTTDPDATVVLHRD